jgi:uncharacterized membrane protein
MAKHETAIIIGTYPDKGSAEGDWVQLEKTAKSGHWLADAAVVEKDAEGTPKLLEHQHRHGGGKGAIVGAVVGVIFPPSIIVGAVVGAGAGAVVGRLHRSLGRGKVNALGETLDSGEVAVIAVVDVGSIDAFKESLAHAQKIHTEETGLSDSDMAVAVA